MKELSITLNDLKGIPDGGITVVFDTKKKTKTIYGGKVKKIIRY